jgi:hypothetical protein
VETMWNCALECASVTHGQNPGWNMRVLGGAQQARHPYISHLFVGSWGTGVGPCSEIHQKT